MALVNKLQKQVDLPVWEWMRFLPQATAAGTAMCAIDDGNARYMYVLTATAVPNSFWRYDTWSDAWALLAAPPVVPATSLGLKYSKYSGFRGKVLYVPDTTHIRIAGVRAGLFDGMTVRIISGTGAGQERTVTAGGTSAPTVVDGGFFSTVSGVATATDGLKKWTYNQWQGYHCRATYGTGLGQVRKILYNDPTILYFNDVNWQQLDSWHNTGWSSQSPYAAPAAQTGYQIEYSTLTLSSAWTTSPDATSTFLILSGGIWATSSAGTPGWSTHQYYDIATDVWYTKTAIAGNIVAALGTDWSLERTGEIGGAYVSSVTATAGTARTLTASTAWTVDQWVNYQLRILSGTGAGQRRRIVGNTATILTVERNFDVNPDNTSVFSIFANTDLMYFSGDAQGSLLSYNVEQDTWATSNVFDFGTVRQAYISVPGATGWPAQQEPIGITSIVRVTTGILSGVINVAGTGYTIGDIVTCSTSGTLGTFIITACATGGIPSAIALCASGSGYGAGSSATTGGTGSSLTITLTVGTTGLVTTAINHGLVSGQSIVIGGLATDTWWNKSFTILGVGGTATFSLDGTGSTATPALTGTLNATTVIDMSKNWSATGNGEHAGRLCLLQAAGPTPAAGTGLMATRITSNTANTLTILTNNAPTNGTWRYMIVDPCCFGPMTVYKDTGGRTTGYVTSSSSTSITDSSQTWNTSLANGRWVGYRVRIESGTGVGSEAAITSNTATTLNVASWPNGTPDTTSRYRIMDSFGTFTSGAAGVGTNTAMNLPASLLVNKRLRVCGGSAAPYGQEVVITANTATTITTAIGTPSNVNSYTVLEPPASGTNCGLQWIFGGTSNYKGRGIIKARGNQQQFDMYDIPTEKWDISLQLDPQPETLVVGSMYAYDGGNKLYFTVGATGRVYVIDIPTWMIRSASLTPYAQGVGLAGNRMEIVTTVDNLDYLYIMRHTGQEFWRSLIYWES